MKGRMKRWLFLGHRWLGMALGVLFVLWFISGVVMMYVRMPILTAPERFAQLRHLDLTQVRISPAAAWKTAKGKGEPRRVRMNIVLGRPAYHFLPANEKWRTVFADTGERLKEVTPQQGALAAQSFAPGNAHFLGRAGEIDQWTLTNSLNLHRPLLRYAMDDRAQTELYVSELTGEVVMRSTHNERKWAWLGPILHWGAPEFFRRHVALWRNSLLWLSFFGTLLALSGLLIALVRWKRGGYNLRDKAGQKHRTFSPYRGARKWHHFSGLVFGFFTLTWILSGWLYTNPGGTRSKPTSTVTTFTPFNDGGIRPELAGKPAEVKALTGGPLRISAVKHSVLTAWQEIGGAAPKDVELVHFSGRPFWMLYRDWNQSFIVAAQGPRFSAPRLPLDDLLARIALMQPQAKVSEVTLLHSYDSFYYAVGNVAPKRLPVLRAKFGNGVWFYINPHDGSIFRRYDAYGRLMRWLINGLHCFDFPFLMFNRPLWDVTIICLSLGGLVLSGSGVWMGGKRLWSRARIVPAAQELEAVAGKGKEKIHA